MEERKGCGFGWDIALCVVLLAVVFVVFGGR